MSTCREVRAMVKSRIDAYRLVGALVGIIGGIVLLALGGLKPVRPRLSPEDARCFFVNVW